MSREQEAKGLHEKANRPVRKARGLGNTEAAQLPNGGTRHAANANGQVVVGLGDRVGHGRLCDLGLTGDFNSIAAMAQGPLPRRLLPQERSDRRPGRFFRVPLNRTRLREVDPADQAVESGPVPEHLDVGG
jgi:hypothetical protein